MRTAPVLNRRETSEIEVSPEATQSSAGFVHRVGAFLREFLEILPPTIFFIIGFNMIVLTTNLLLSDYGARFASFMLATVSALIVAKALLIANAMPAIRRQDRAPLIRPILFKTAFYWAAVFIVHLLEEWIRYRLGEHYVFGGFLPHEMATFSWAHFIAVQLWILLLFLIFVTARELNHLFGEGELWHLLFTSRRDLQLDRRQRIRELIRLGHLADAHSLDEFRDPSSAAHSELVGIVGRLAAEPRRRAA